MLAAKASPSADPTPTPMPPIASPSSRKSRRIAPRVAPMVRRMAMSAVLVRTNITRLDTILNAATSTIMVSTTNITLVWPWIAAKKPKFA